MNHSAHHTLPGSRASARVRASQLVCAAALAFSATALAFDQPADPDFKGRQFTIMRLPVVAGATGPLGGQGFRPGQTITVRHDGEVLNAKGPITVDEKGRFWGEIRIPANAVPGIHQVVVTTSAPTASAIFTIQVSPRLPLSGEQNYDIVRSQLPPGLYQAVYSKRHDRLYVTSSAGRTVDRSALLQIDPKTLAVTRSVSPPPVPGKNDGTVLGVFGLGLDESNDRLWAGNVRAGTVSVYRASDLQFVKHFEPGVLKHPRDIAVDGTQGKVFVSDMELGGLAVFDAGTLTARPLVRIESSQQKEFVPTGMALDEPSHTLYVAGLRSQEIAVIDTRTETVRRVIHVPGARGLMGLAFDPAERLLFIASQNSDNVTILNVDTDTVRAQTLTGANPLSVAFHPGQGLAYVANRASATVTVVDRDGRIVANLPGSSYNNHVTLDGQGNVIVLNKKTEANEPDGDQISRISRRR